MPVFNNNATFEPNVMDGSFYYNGTDSTSHLIIPGISNGSKFTLSMWIKPETPNLISSIQAENTTELQNFTLDKSAMGNYYPDNCILNINDSELIISINGYQPNGSDELRVIKFKFHGKEVIYEHPYYDMLNDKETMLAISFDNGIATCYVNNNRVGKLYLNDSSLSTAQHHKEVQPEGDFNKNWAYPSLSDNGKHIVAPIYDGRVWLSHDGGNTWSEIRPYGDVNRYWRGALISDSGECIVCIDTSWDPRISYDGGNTWSTISFLTGLTNINQIAMSSTGQYLVASVNNRLYVSSTYAETWTEVQPKGDIDAVWQCDISHDATHIIVSDYSLSLYLSTDFGNTWTRIYGDGSGYNPSGSLIRALKLQADSTNYYCFFSIYGYEESRGELHFTKNGESWEEFSPSLNEAPEYERVASSSDGRVLLAIEYQIIHASFDYGLTWEHFKPNESGVAYWNTVAVNRAGTTLLSAEDRLYFTSIGASVHLGSPQDEIVDVNGTYYKGYISKFMYLDNTASSISEIDKLYNYNKGLTYDSLYIPKIIYDGRLNLPKYNFTKNKGFTVSLESRELPEVIDDTISYQGVGVRLDVALYQVLKTISDTMTLQFWDGVKWVDSIFNTETQTVEWLDDVPTFPTEVSVFTEQETKKWTYIKNLCDRYQMNFYLDYDIINKRKVLKIFRKNSLNLTSTEEIVHYRFNDNLDDSSYNKNNATGTNYSFTSAKTGKGVYLQGGESKITLPSIVNLTSTFSMSFWFRFELEDENVLDNKHNLISIDGFVFDISFDKDGLYYEDSTGIHSIPAHIDYTSFNHLYIVNSDNNLSFYLNNEFITTVPTFQFPGFLSKFIIGNGKYDTYIGIIDDFRLFDKVLSDEERDEIYNYGYGTRMGIGLTDNDIVQGINLTNVYGFGRDIDTIYNKVKVYGRQVSDNIITLHTAQDLVSQSKYWPKQLILTDDLLDSTDLVKSRAEFELSKYDSGLLPLEGKISADGLLGIDAGSFINISIPNCTAIGLFEVKSISHSFGNNYMTTLDISGKQPFFTDNFINRFDPDTISNKGVNVNDMVGSLTLFFDKDISSSATLSGVSVVDSVLQLNSGETSGILVSSILEATNNVSQCEFRRYENFNVENDVYEVSNNGGLTWETIDREQSIHVFSSEGNRLQFRMTLNRPESTSPSPKYGAVALLYK